MLRHIEATAPGLPVPGCWRPRPRRGCWRRVLTPLEPRPGGQPWAVVPDGPLRGRVVHALSYLDGRLLRSVTTDPPLRRAMGATLAELGRALRGFDDPLVRRPLLWDLAQLPQLRPLAAERPPGPRTALLTAQLARLTAETLPRLAAQRSQLLHNDFSPDNTLISADGRRVSGIIDFGDVTVTALVNDVAIAVANLLGDDGRPARPRARPDRRVPRRHAAHRGRARPAARPDPGPRRGPDRHQRMAGRTVPGEPRLRPAQHPPGVGAAGPAA